MRRYIQEAKKALNPNIYSRKHLNRTLNEFQPTDDKLLSDEAQAFIAALPRDEKIERELIIFLINAIQEDRYSVETLTDLYAMSYINLTKPFFHINYATGYVDDRDTHLGSGDVWYSEGSYKNITISAIQLLLLINHEILIKAGISNSDSLGKAFALLLSQINKTLAYTKFVDQGEFNIFITADGDRKNKSDPFYATLNSSKAEFITLTDGKIAHHKQGVIKTKIREEHRVLFDRFMQRAMPSTALLQTFAFLPMNHGTLSSTSSQILTELHLRAASDADVKRKLQVLLLRAIKSQQCPAQLADGFLAFDMPLFVLKYPTKVDTVTTETGTETHYNDTDWKSIDMPVLAYLALTKPELFMHLNYDYVKPILEAFLTKLNTPTKPNIFLSPRSAAGEFRYIKTTSQHNLSLSITQPASSDMVGIFKTSLTTSSLRNNVTATESGHPSLLHLLNHALKQTPQAQSMHSDRNGLFGSTLQQARPTPSAPSVVEVPGGVSAAGAAAGDDQAPPPYSDTVELSKLAP